MKKSKGILLFSFVICLTGVLTAWFLGVFEPEWKKYSLESPMEKIYKTDTKNGIKHKEVYRLKEEYAKLGLKGLVYHYEIKENLFEEGLEPSREQPILLCSVDVYSLSKPKKLSELNQYALSDDMENAIKQNPQIDFYVKEKILKNDDFYKETVKETHIHSKWLPANLVFAINAENVFAKIDSDGIIIDRTTASVPRQWKQLEICLKDVERKNGREFVNPPEYWNSISPSRRYAVVEQFHPKDNQAEFKAGLMRTIFSDKSFIRMDDSINCSFQYDPLGSLDNQYSDTYWKDKPKPDLETDLKARDHARYINYKQYGKVFKKKKKTFIDIYNIDENMYVRVFSKYSNGLPYIQRYCEE